MKTMEGIKTPTNNAIKNGAKDNRQFTFSKPTLNYKPVEHTDILVNHNNYYDEEDEGLEAEILA